MDKSYSNNQMKTVSDTSINMIKHWIISHINRPIQGFEHKKNGDGSEYSKEQQISATQYQVMNIADYFLSHGKSYEETLNVLQLFK